MLLVFKVTINDLEETMLKVTRKCKGEKEDVIPTLESNAPVKECYYKHGFTPLYKHKGEHVSNNFMSRK